MLLTHLYMSQSKRFIDYAPTSLERNYKYELLTEHDLGVHVDLILPEAYEKPEEQVGTKDFIAISSLESKMNEMREAS